MASSFLVCPVHVGRDDAVDTLADSAKAARRSGRLLFIGGEAGVGKSRLAGHAVRIAEQEGFLRLVGDCSPEGTAPYSAFAVALRRHTRAMQAEELAALFSGRSALATALLPEVEAELGRTGTPAAPEPEDLYASIWHVIARVAGRTGALLLLEDVHWADVDSLRLLHHLAREIADLPVWLVATYRTDELHRRHPLLALLGDLERERLADEIRLEPLGRDDVRTMLRAIFDGAPVSDEFLDAVLDRTDGNPFFVEELAKTLVDQGDLYLEAGLWNQRSLATITFPPNVREALLARFRRLPPDAAEVLTFAACAGDRIDFDVLAVAFGDEAAVARAMSEGLESQLLVERRDGAQLLYQFRHALTREALVDEVVGPARARVHAALADALVQVYGAENDTTAAEVADHLEKAGDGPRAAEFALRAARRAAAAGALDEAANRYEAGLRLGAHDSSTRLRLLIEAAEATFTERDAKAAVAFALEAQRIARSTGDPIAEAEALWILEAEQYLQGDAAGAVGLQEEALRLLEGRDENKAARTLARLVRLYVLADRPADATALSKRAIAIAESAGNYRALSSVYATLQLIAETEEEADRALDLSLAAARRAEDRESELAVCGNRAYSEAWRGRLTSARARMEQAVELGRPLRPGRVNYYEAGLAWVCSLSGDFRMARQLAENLRNDRDVPTRLVALAALTEVEERCGSDDDARLLVEEQFADAERSGQSQRLVPALAARARLTARRDGAELALPIFRQALQRTVNELGRGSHWMFSPDAAWALAATGAMDELDAWVDDISALTGRDGHPNNDAADLVCRAAQAGAHGDEETARRLVEEAVAAFRAMPYPAREVETLVELAAVAERSGDHEAAVASARHAHEVAHSLGATRLVEMAADAIDRTEGSAVLATVVFTDIVGSTERAAKLGDMAWRELLERHNTIVRREIKRNGGREIDTAGDGFLVSFDSPARAVRFASAVISGLRSVGVDIRAGIHTGECRATGHTLSGLAVHIASRIAAMADGGEVLVSSTVRDLVTGSGMVFVDHGLHALKGIPDEWHVYRLDR